MRSSFVFFVFLTWRNRGGLSASPVLCVVAPACSQIHTVVIGHCGTHLTSNIETFTAFGLSSKETLALLRETVALSAKQLQSSLTFT